MNTLRYLLNKKVLLAGAVLVLPVAIWAGIAGSQSANASSCDSNDIVRCGYSSPADLVAKTRSSGELQNIYNRDLTGFGYGIGNDFQNAKHATIYKDGRIVLDDGTIVATNGLSMGREKASWQPYTINIAGKNYYYSYNQTGFAPNSLPAYVSLNDDHSLKFAALTACGNPAWGVTSAYKCNVLNKRKVNDTTYAFSANTYARNSTLTKLVYEFGDGTSQTVTSNFAQEVSHVYKPGNFTARVTAYFNSFGQTKSDTRAQCTTTVSVPQPPKPIYACSSLTASAVNGSRTKFAYTAKGTTGNGATLEEVTFIYDDGTKEVVKTNSLTTIKNHEYVKAGAHVTKVDMKFKEGSDLNNPKCAVTTTVLPETCSTNPNLPECKPKECKPGIPEGDARCVDVPAETPKEIPSTGPAELIGGAMGLSSIAGAGIYYRNSRRKLIDTILNR